MKRKNKTIKIIEKKLGRERAWGQAFKDKNLIEIEKTAKRKKRLKIVMHEGIHIAFPELPEYKVVKAERILSNILWNQNYRRVDN